MTRRRTVVLASAATLLGIVALVTIILALLTRTDFGRERLRRFVATRWQSAMKGKLYLGRVSGSIFTDIVVDSIELRDEADSLFLAAGRTYIDFDPRDFLDMRIVLPRVEMMSATLHLDIDSAGTVNFRKIFPPGPPGPPRTTRAWGDYIALKHAEIHKLNVQVRLPWSPDTALRGAKRDSAIAYALNREDKEVRRVGDHFEQTWRWTEGRVVLDSARLDDRDPKGRVFYVNSLDANGFDPPLHLRKVRGVVRVKGDSLFLDVPRFNLPASTGSASGKVWWGKGPTRFDLNIVGDSVSLSDVAWVYPTLPRTGGGRMKLAIRNEADPRILDYVLTDMDVRSTDSWLRGTMTFGIGAPITIVKDVDMVAQPLDFKLVETLSGAPLPYPFRGTLTGTVKARGGPLTRWVVDAADIVYRDANVPGAVTVGSGSGELNILEPSNTAFHGFNLRLDQLDLRTVQFLNPAFPKLNGTIAGRTTLDSTLLDIRFRNADLTHADGTGPGTHVTGAGRVTFGEATTYDVALDAAPLSFTTLRRAYTESRIPLRGEYTGPLRLQGTLQDLEVITELRGPAGMIAYDGRIDADSIGGYGIHGGLRFAGLDLRTFLDTAITPPTLLTGRADLDVTGDSLAKLQGSAIVELDRSLIDSVLVYSGARARVRFQDRRMSVDTLHAESVVGTLAATGALGLSPEIKDTLRFTVSVDSLGGLRRYFAPARVVADNDDGQSLEVDSLKLRTEEATGRLYGSLDTLGVTFAVRAVDVDALGVEAKRFRLSADFADVLHDRRGVLDVTADTLTVAGVRLTQTTGKVTLARADSGDFSLLAEATNGPKAEASGDLLFAGDTTTVRVESLVVGIREHRLTLARPSDIRIEPNRTVVDTARLVGEAGEELLLGGDFPETGAVRAFARVDSLHLADIGDLTQFRVPLAGNVVAAANVTGTRESPEIELDGRIRGAKVGEVSIAGITFGGRYADRRALAQVQLLSQDSVVADLQANVPVDIETFRLVRGDTMRVALRSRDVDLRLVESFTPRITRAAGRLTANVDVAGPSEAPKLAGGISITGGAATLPDVGIRLDQVTADIGTVGDTIHIRRLSAHSGDEPNDVLMITGKVARPLSDADRSFDITLDAREFNMVNTRRLATLWISTPTPLTLSGSMTSSILRGTVTVDRGVIYMPETSDKQLITLNKDDLAGLDTVVARRLRLLPRAPLGIVSGLTASGVRVVMGPNVRIQSAESREMNIQLGGALEVDVANTGRAQQLVLNGELVTERGTYLLNVGGIVQRTFNIESGTLRFYDDSLFNPLLDIRAIYTVPQVQAVYGGRNDVRVGVRIQGTLTQPELDLFSADSLRLADSDLISYLVLGRPSFQIGGTPQQNASQLSAVLLTTGANLLSSRLSGGFFDYVQFQTAADRLQINQVNTATFTSVLSGTQLGVGKQVNDRTIISLNAGVCLLAAGPQSLDPATLWRSIGAKIEYQMRPNLGVAGSLDPPLSSLLCGQTQGFSTSVRQVGFDLFRNFRW